MSTQRPPRGREENLKYQVFFLWIHRTEVTYRAQLCKRGTLLFCQKINVHSSQPELPNIRMRTFTSLCKFLICSYLQLQSTRDKFLNCILIKLQNVFQKMSLHFPTTWKTFKNWNTKCVMPEKKWIVFSGDSHSLPNLHLLWGLKSKIIHPPPIWARKLMVTAPWVAIEKLMGSGYIEYNVLQNKCKTIRNRAMLDLVILYSHWSFFHSSWVLVEPLSQCIIQDNLLKSCVMVSYR